MDKNERDTHFQGFADLLASEIDEVLHLLDNPYFVSSGMRNEVVALIAQRAYDLIKFVLENTSAVTLDSAMRHFDNVVANVPDLTEWPQPQ